MLEVFHPFILHPHTIYLVLFNILPFPTGMSGMSSHEERKKILFYNGNKFCRVCTDTETNFSTGHRKRPADVTTKMFFKPLKSSC